MSRMRKLTCGFKELSLSLLEIQGNVKGIDFFCEHYTNYNLFIIRVFLFWI